MSLTDQQEYVLRRLRERGSDGVHTFELRSEYIGNPSQRIAELEELGYEIFTGPREKLNGRAHGVRYRLVRDAEVESGTTTDTRPLGGGATDHASTPAVDHPSGGGQLFDTPDATTGPRPHWQQEEAA